MNIWIALYKGKGSLVNHIVRKWTKSQYSHAELILEDKKTWIGISPFIKAEIVKREVNVNNSDHWDFFKIIVTEEQYKTIIDFYNLTKGAKYDWFGMLLSQFLPFHIKQKNKWYCSEWILYALRISSVIDWKIIKIFDQSDLSPSKLHHMLLLCNLEKTNLEFTNE
mgnify:CR=1 FL=1|tara:strand:+ start:417 stop:914 length:498 start_codon:yes stop_codon:yes gene_type:complete